MATITGVEPKKAIPTEYKGIALRSRLEAQCAFLFDTLGLEWQYEPRSYMLSNGVPYTPDFYLPKQRAFVECRGYNNPRADSQIEAFGEMVSQEQTGPDGHTILRFLTIRSIDFRCYRARHEGYEEGVLVMWCRCCASWVLMGLGERECPLCYSHGCSISRAYLLSCEAGKILINEMPSEHWDGPLFSFQQADGAI